MTFARPSFTLEGTPAGLARGPANAWPRREQPDPAPCPGCAKPIDWVWMRTFTGEQWVRGSYPCGSCKYAESLNEGRAARAEAIRRTGLPLRLRGYSLRTSVEMQPTREPVGDFMRRIKAIGGKRLGITHACIRAYQTICRWQPGASLFVYGPPGTGKSTLAAALTADLVTAGDLELRERTWDELVAKYGDDVPVTREGERVRVMVRRHDVLFIDESELMDRERLSWKGDPVPRLQVSEAELLVLDDLGVETHQKVLDTVEQVITYRHRERLPMVITSNVPWNDLGGTYSRRVVDRLHEMVPFANRVELGGATWRDPPAAPVEGAKRKPVARSVTMEGV